MMELYTPDMAGSGQYGVCAKCGLLPTKEGHDGCLGELVDPDIMNVCCGHGDNSQAYVQLWSDRENPVRGEPAIALINKYKAHS